VASNLRIFVHTNTVWPHSRYCQRSKGGPPLVLIHAATASATQWFPNIKNLSRDFRIYAIDILGDAGMSKVTKASQNKSDYALWLSDVFDGLGFQKRI
jgi:pimeloyl-ACP methyl ester carboxylesterase